MKTDVHTNGSMVKKHISLKTGFGYNATRRTSFFRGSRLVNEFVLQFSSLNFKDTSNSSSSPTTSSSFHETRERETELKVIPLQCVDDRTVQPVVDTANQKLPKTSQKETKIERDTRCLPTQIAQVLKSRSGCKNS